MTLKKLALAVAAVAAMVMSGSAKAETVDARVFKHRMNLTTSGYTGTTTLANFPILVRLSAGNPSGFDPADAGENGEELRFYTKDGELLAHEIDEWNPSGESVVWVKIPSMTAETTICMGWGIKEGCSAPIAPAKDTWTSYYAVWHMNEAAGEKLIDRTGNGHDFADDSGGCAAVPVLDTYTIGHGRKFTALVKSPAFSSLGSNFTIGMTLKTTLSAWPSGTPSAMIMRTKSAWNGADQGFQMSVQQRDTQIAIFPPGSTGRNFTCPSICTSPLYLNFSYGRGSYNPHLGSVYMAGVRINGINDVIEGHSSEVMAFAGTDAIPLIFDEVRIRAVESITKDASGNYHNDWIVAEYATKTSAEFLTWEEPRGFVAVVESEAEWFGYPVLRKPTYVQDLAGKDLVEDVDYELSWSGSTNAVGTAIVTITGIGSCADVESKDLSYELTNGYGAGKTLFVSAAATGAASEDCAAWATAGTLSAAVAALTAGTAEAPTLIVLKAGTYDFSSAEQTGSLLSIDKNYVTVRSETGDSADVVIRGTRDGTAASLRCFSVTGSSAVLQGLTIENFATTDNGGAAYITSSTLVTNCVFSSCQGKTYGGAIYGNANVTVRLSSFISCSTTGGSWSYGGAAYAGKFCDCIFTGCSSGLGGALCQASVADHCTFSGNQASNSGASLSYGNNCKVTDSTFVNHTAGTILQKYSGSITADRCVFSNNTARISDSVPLYNCLITGNTHPAGGGSVAFSATKLVNCTVIGNSCSSSGDWTCALLRNTVCINSLIANNDVENTILTMAGYWTTMTNCVWSGGGGTPSGENIRKVDNGTDFKFSSDPARPFDITRKSRLLLDKGTLDGLGYTAASVDLAGRPRVVKDGQTLAENPNALPDIGCYECQERAPGLMLLIW